MKLLNFNIIKLTACLILGIIPAHYFDLDTNVSLCIIIILLAFLGGYWLVLRQKINRSPYFALLTFFCMIGIGINTYNIKNEKLRSEHYTNIHKKHEPVALDFKIEERLKPDAFSNKYIVSVKSIANKKASGKLLINVRRDSTSTILPVDTVLFTSVELETIQKPLNPHQFDYSKFLELRQVYHQLYVEQSELFLVSNEKTTIYGLADQLRISINEKLITAGFKDDALSIINALLLGQRQTINKSTYNNYVNSGTIHILAVSGLHVGILLLILNFILRPLLYFKYGNFIRPLIIVILLWVFAIIAGLSPSVTRAVTMFSIISIAMHLKRPTNIYNTLAISAFFILLVKPHFLFSVGFQMSYLAVLGIVSVQPIIYSLWRPKYWILDKPWQIFTVTLAAQFGVLPISLFYFHQFPGLFFISNIVVIPFLGLILGLGLLVIALALLNMSHSYITTSYSYIIDSLNEFIAWIAQFESFLFRDIPFTLLQMALSYFIIVTFVNTYKTKIFRWVTLCLVGIIAFQSTMIYNKITAQDDAFIVFNKSRFTIIGQKSGHQLIVHHNMDSIKQRNDNVISNYKVGELIDSISKDSLQHIYQFKDKTILVIDSLAVYKGIRFKTNYVLIRNSPRLNLNRVIDTLKPTQVIVDASNYKSYVKRWKATCAKRKIPFHYTNEKGAFILE
ncbi:ComEC/Rec2 family competence protein [Winogradskyella luteola]|uniref:ComEC/Rec2 family competence protein n=1 Tax=Winogradskyella luteola TaxID=2828330 RepID=A0A9X1F8K9_9FLAO|nr:ComEC/Rec2 family competence protein [Winogradskyella luteola]MBV7269477.1 ComEC/Rec2 family competence protein [Winogradskyella luteola]